MDKKTVADFFDQCAPWWDADMIRNEPVIAKILDNAGIVPGVSVLDVACGTGVLFPDYLQRGAASVTGIDISPEMAKLAQEKFPQVKVICGDVEETEFEQQFDAVMVYNAFPHFPEPERLIRTLASLLKDGGHLTVAHGASREAIDSHHNEKASKVSNGLMAAEDLQKLFDTCLHTDVVISDDHMYQVSGVKK